MNAKLLPHMVKNRLNDHYSTNVVFTFDINFSQNELK